MSTTIPGTIAVPSTATVVSTTTFGDPVAAAINLILRNGSNVAPGGLIYCAGASNIIGAASTINVALDSEESDTDGWHTGSNAFITCQTAGRVVVNAGVQFGSTGTSRDGLTLVKTSAAGGVTSVVGQSHVQGFTTAHSVCVGGPVVGVELLVGDTVTLEAFSTAGGTLTNATGSAPDISYNTWLSWKWVSV